MNKITPKTIREAIEKTRNQNFYYQPMWHEMTKEEWLKDKVFNFTEEEINNADNSGLIGDRHGFKCYIRKPLTFFAMPNNVKKVKPNFNKLFGKNK